MRIPVAEQVALASEVVGSFGFLSRNSFPASHFVGCRRVVCAVADVFAFGVNFDVVPAFSAEVLVSVVFCRALDGNGVVCARLTFNLLHGRESSPSVPCAADVHCRSTLGNSYIICYAL